MPKIVVRYFNAKGYGESIRTLLAYGGEEFEDVRYVYEDWNNNADKQVILQATPFAQLPMMEIDGKVYAQSTSISRYLGRKFGLAGDNEDEAFEIDQNIDYFIDLRSAAAQTFYEEDPDAKRVLQKRLSENLAPKMLTKLNEIITKNNGFIALGKLTWGDFVIAGVLDYVKILLGLPDLEKQYPGFAKIVDAVYSVPQVRAYAEKAPKCDN